MLLQREVVELQLYLAAGDVVFHESRLNSLIECGARRTAEILPCLHGYWGIGVTQCVSVLPRRGDAGIVERRARGPLFIRCPSQKDSYHAGQNDHACDQVQTHFVKASALV